METFSLREMLICVTMLAIPSAHLFRLVPHQLHTG